MSAKPNRRSWSVRIEQDESGTHFHVPPPDLLPDEPDIMLSNPSLKLLSPIEVKVVRLLCARGWMKREQIATEIAEQPEGRLTVILPNLVERGWIESATSRGYHLDIPSSSVPDEYRKAVLAWLDSLDSPSSPG